MYQHAKQKEKTEYIEITTLDSNYIITINEISIKREILNSKKNHIFKGKLDFTKPLATNISNKNK